nr:unnamed protein product [Digitaria exilis]
MAAPSAPLLRSHPHRGALCPSSPRHRSAAAAVSLLGFPPRKAAGSSRRLPYTAVRSSSTASPSVPVEEAAAAEAPTNDAEEQERVVLPTNETSDRLLRIRHTCAHVMAMAVQKLFPNSKVTIGPWIDNGFYYDFDMEPLTDKDLKKIKKEMDRIIRQNLPLVREEVSREEAQKRIEALNEPYKLEILESIKEEPITIYHIGEEWWDLCAGPHVESTGKIDRKAVELESVAGAYWRGDEKNQMLQRIYGTAWENEDQLKAYIYFKEEAKRRDHRRLGQDLDLFSIQDDAHIFCLEDQIQDEIRGVLDLTEQILGQFGFRYYEINLSTRPEKSVGNDDIWEKATIALKNALNDKGWEYKVDEGGGAFYGPKIDLKIEDALGRKWQCSTVQLQYCNEVASELKSRGFRVEVCHGERLPKLIRNAETQKVPLMAVVGPKEVQARTLTIRSRHNGEIGTMPVDEFITRLQLAVTNKSSL